MKAFCNDKTDKAIIRKTLVLILGILDEQETTNKLLLDRISKVRKSLKESEVYKKKCFIY